LVKELSTEVMKQEASSNK